MYNNRNNNNSHYGLTLVIICAIALAVFIFVSIPKGFHNDEKWAGDAHIEFEIVMVREKPAGKIIGHLENADKVKTTGNRYYFIDFDDSLGSDHWSEIKLADESVVWVIGSAVELDD